MGGGFPFARLAAATVLSIGAHLLIAWIAGALVSAPAPDGGATRGAMQVRLGSDLAAERAATPGPGVRGAPAPAYWPAAGLDVRPQIMTRVMPEYPADLPSGVRGRVVLELHVAASGRLDRVRVVRAEPTGRFEDAALKAFSGARFTPGQRKGQAVPSLLRIEVTFGD